MLIRPRRLRFNQHTRDMAREVRVSCKSLILPVFIMEGENVIVPINSLEGHFYYSPDTVFEAVDSALKYGVNKFLLFGVPTEKDEIGSQSFDENGIIQKAVWTIKERYRDEVFVITDVCMCEYTSHGHCGILEHGYVDNDKTLEYLTQIALSYAKAGADMVAPSDMMDGRVAAIRQALDKHNFINTLIMSYAVKYSSSFYGPFRDAAKSAPSFGDRKSYQMDYHNKKEAVKEALLDMNEGADILMVKPALSYLDVIGEVSRHSNLPTAAYSVSGEYAMIKAAAKMNLIDEYKVMCETAVSIFRAGADILITYYAKEIAEAINKGDIG
ncbi:MAG TPA: porphobilinogen synthase [Acetivibrio sp.]|uniref:porphobilinogen synthase n=1 Tax=Acetivibrio sp. TaxID=1872092 RepID=UPI002C0502EA|nr:porphobilinogen synthase [Acetivibrio sp.]HOM01601.1 porphobilinogen synthase [Acetivibrio sp.]